MRTLRIALPIAAAVALCGSAQARPMYHYEFPIDGLQEVLPVVTPGFGDGVVDYDSDTNMLSWTITYSGLIGSPTVSHFHGAAPPGVNAGVQVDIAVLSGGIASPMIGSTVITELQEADLLAGLWYVNIHSTFRPGGEIRGQVVPAPGVTSILGLGALVALRRRR